MTVHELLLRHSRVYAAGRAARLGARIALLGATFVAVLLSVERMGVDLPFLWMPAASTPGFLAKALSFIAFSLAGLIQGAVLLAGVFALAFLARRLGPVLFRQGPRPTAHALDGRMRTDRYSAALQARGRLAGLAAAHATKNPPPDQALAPKPPGRLQKWLTVGAVLLVLLVAFSPGSAGGESGPAPAPGQRGRDRRTLQLRLLGEDRTFFPGQAVPVHVVIEAPFAPERDLKLEVSLEIDGGPARATGRHLFLAAGAPGEDAVVLDLRAFAGELAPGEHVAVALADDARSNEYRFRIDPPDPRRDPPDGGRSGKKAKPKGKDKGADPQRDPKFVEPLVRDGDKVKKRAKVPIEVPGRAPQEKSLKEAWPELQKRKEAALKRAGLSPHARQLVFEYFERLRPDK